LFGTEEQVANLIDDFLEKTKGETADNVEYKQHIPEELVKAYSEQNLKALWLMFRRYELHCLNLDTGNTIGVAANRTSNETILSYEKLANKFNNNLKEHGAANWYDWNCEKWGTKWNLDSGTSSEFEDRENGLAVIKYDFDTAWSPPDAVIKELAKQYPELKMQLRYWEGGMAFQGRLRLKGRKVYEEKRWDYSGPKGG
jgi:hypothetical protein